MSGATEGDLAPTIAPAGRNPGVANENPAGIGLLTAIGEELRNHGGSVWAAGPGAGAARRVGHAGSGTQRAK